MVLRYRFATVAGWARRYPVLMAVVNLSEGRDQPVLERLREAAGSGLLDVHSDPDHHRSVWTLAGAGVVEATHRLATEAVELLDLRTHRGVHPRIGVVDVVPWIHLTAVPGPLGRRVLSPAPIRDAVAARGAWARWVATALAVPAVCYGPPGAPAAGERTLPEVRRRLWRDLGPDVAPAGPGGPHPSAGAVAVGARPPLVAYNLWLAEPDLDLARAVAAAVRAPGLRTLGLAVGGAVQVSCNLTDPWNLGPGAAWDAVARRAEVARAELVGLVPGAVLAAEPRHRWPELDIDEERSVEARLEQAGLDGGSWV